MSRKNVFEHLSLVMSRVMYKWIVPIIALIILCGTGEVLALGDEELKTIRDGFDSRRDQMLRSQVSSPYPPYESKPIWNKLDFALAALYLNTNIDEANDALLEACDLVLNNPDCPTACDFHWNGNLFCRIYEYFNVNSSYFPGRLTANAEAKICQVLWFWLERNSKITDTNIHNTQTWWIWESENHHAMKISSNWNAAQILKNISPYNSYSCADGSTVQHHYDAWTAYFKEYFKERAKRGGLIEIASHVYGKYTLQGWYNFYDFAEDALLRQRAEYLLDMWWCDAAMEQFDGVRGGGKSRVYLNKLQPWWDGVHFMGWYYLGVGSYAADKHPAHMCLATSTYRLPLVVMDIALDYDGKGVYEFKSRRPGRNTEPTTTYPDGHLLYKADPDYGGIYRYTYCTPKFIMGTSMVEKVGHDDWTWISEQNRYTSVIFHGDKDKFILPSCESTTDGRTNYNQHWSIQNKGTLIIQKLSTNENTGDMRVYFGPALTPEEEDGWVFVNTGDAYAAVKPVWGSYSWDDANWLHLSDDYAPVIIEVALASDYMGTFSLFKSAVKAQAIDLNSDVLTYTGLGNSGEFTFYTNSSQVPQLDGVPINFEPNFTFSSPFINEAWADGVITISKDNRQKVLDFNADITKINETVMFDKKGFYLLQNYPNPFNPSTTIKYSIPNVGNENFHSVQLKVYDILGREVTTLVNKEQKPGNYEVKFDASSLTSSLYFYRLTANGYTQTKKMILIR